jgi:ribulose 1,5-bisphosphate synthetase/thiazole synthase
MLTTPGGNPASATSSATRRLLNGVSSAGLSTTVLPAARAGPIFHEVNISGKFHGTICPTTPTGSRST